MVKVVFSVMAKLSETKYCFSGYNVKSVFLKPNNNTEFFTLIVKIEDDKNSLSFPDQILNLNLISTLFAIPSANLIFRDLFYP